MIQDPNVERIIDDKLKPLQGQIKELQAELFKLMAVKNNVVLPVVSGSLPDIYKDDLNEKRIARYMELAEGYNIDVTAVANIFSEGADFYKRVVGNDL